MRGDNRNVQGYQGDDEEKGRDEFSNNMRDAGVSALFGAGCAFLLFALTASFGSREKLILNYGLTNASFLAASALFKVKRLKLRSAQVAMLVVFLLVCCSFGRDFVFPDNGKSPSP